MRSSGTFGRLRDPANKEKWSRTYSLTNMSPIAALTKNYPYAQPRENIFP